MRNTSSPGVSGPVSERGRSLLRGVLSNNRTPPFETVDANPETGESSLSLVLSANVFRLLFLALGFFALSWNTGHEGYDPKSEFK